MNLSFLIVNADDLGMTHSITDGIFLAHSHGILTSASLMPNMPAAEYAVERLQDTRTLGVGCHLNICQGRSLLHLSEVPSLVDSSGLFHPPLEMARRLWRWQVNPREIEAEFRAQLRWVKIHGISPTHADSHHHMHLYPAAAVPFARVLASEGVFCARSSRCAVFPRPHSLGGPHEGGPLRRILVGFYRTALQSTIFRRLISPDARISFLSRDRNNPSALAARRSTALHHLPQGIFELACHPSLPRSSDGAALDAICSQREEELRWLVNPELRAIIAGCGIRLISYARLPSARASLDATRTAAA
ncbi:MAG TPA: ChbG/HpnK family deacetylase [Candidatus Acidoferrum sp.]|nr:ChbG/HpnK family deacetylase [Candidatus Acidoferrum sp.]